MSEKEITEKLTTEHEIYISVGLKNPMKPSTFKDIIDTLLFENIGYMQSWGTHTKAEYIGIVDDLDDKVKTQTKYIGFLQSCVRSGEKWEGTIDEFINRLSGGESQSAPYGISK